MLSLPDSPGDSRNLVKSPYLPGGRMNLPDFYHIEIRLKSTLMAENPYKTSPFSICEVVNQTWTGDRGFKKLEKDAKEHRTRSFFHSEMINKLKKMAAGSEAHVILP